MSLDEALKLYLVTDRTWLDGGELSDVVEDSILNGTTFVQLREKETGYEEMLLEAEKISKVCRKYKVPFVVNDNLEVAKNCHCDGVHIGQDDESLKRAREILGAEKIVGVSVQTVEQAKLAEQGGADYLGVGAVFPTSTKTDAADVDYETLRDICHCVKIPVVAIGGISRDNVLDLKGSDIDGVAVISAILASKDIGESTRDLSLLLDEVVHGS